MVGARRPFMEQRFFDKSKGRDGAHGSDVACDTVARARRTAWLAGHASTGDSRL